jgi:hypothetical protein
MHTDNVTVENAAKDPTFSVIDTGWTVGGLKKNSRFGRRHSLCHIAEGALLNKEGFTAKVGAERIEVIRSKIARLDVDITGPLLLLRNSRRNP